MLESASLPPMSNSTTGNSFTLTDDDINLANNLSFWSTIPGTVISFLSLLGFCIAACVKRAREKLDRVSFRLVVCTLVFNLLFGVAYEVTPNSASSLCNFGAFAVNFTLSFSTFFTTCIAINLQLVLVHKFNGKKLEKYYIATTILLSIILNVPAFGLHQFGWDDDTGTCWYSNADPVIRLKWIIGTQSFWISLAATVEMVCSFVVLFWLYREFKGVTKAIQNSPLTVQKSSQANIEGAMRMSANEDGLTPIAFIARDKRYRRIILRIVMYPIVSLVVNYTTVILDLNATIHNLNTRYDFNLLILDLIFYGLRPLAYGILAAVDPAFINAIFELKKEIQRRSGSGTSRQRTITQLNFVDPGTVQSDTSTQGRVSLVAEGSKDMDNVLPQLMQSGAEVSITSRSEDIEDGRSNTMENNEIRELEKQL